MSAASEGPDGVTEQPDLTIVKGNPTEEEVAALVAVLLARRPVSGGPTVAIDRNSAGWSAYWRSVRAPLHPGPGAWRTSGRAF